MCTSRTDFDVTTARLQNKGYFQGVHCNTTVTIVFTQFVVLQYMQYNKLSGYNVDFATGL